MSDRRAVRNAFAIGAVFAVLLILASSAGDVERMTFGDGDVATSVARSFTTPPDEVEPGVVIRGSSLRFGRAGLPALVWLASAGRDAAMPYVQPLLMVLAAGAASAGATVLFASASPLIAIAPFASPGFALSVTGGYAEALAVPLCLWAVVFARRRRWWVVAALMAYALLTKEHTAAVLAALALGALRDRDRGAAVPLVASGLPVTAWYLFVAGRWGHIPVLDPYLRVDTTTIGTPVLALWDSLRAPDSPGSLVTAIAHIAIAIASLALARRSRLAWPAALSGLALLTAGPFAWHFIGDAFRVWTFMDLFVILAVIEIARGRAQRGASPSPAAV